MNTSKIVYKPIGLIGGALAGLAAGMVSKRLWRLASGQEETPDPTDERSTWREILVAAAIQGAVFAVVKAAIDRGGAVGVRRITGRWPD